MHVYIYIYGVTLCFTYSVDDDDHQTYLFEMTKLSCSDFDHKAKSCHTVDSIYCYMMIMLLY